MEAGISWMPFLMMRLDKEFSEGRRVVPFLKRRPSEYLRDVRVGTQPIEEPVAGTCRRSWSCSTERTSS
jgi:hypothetical protein